MEMIKMLKSTTISSYILLNRLHKHIRTDHRLFKTKTEKSGVKSVKVYLRPH